MTRGPQPGHAVISGGKSYHITSSGDYVPYDPEKYHAGRERSRWERNGVLSADKREQVL